nr:hypothetical protein [Hugonella massiliensis]
MIRRPPRSTPLSLRDRLPTQRAANVLEAGSIERGVNAARMLAGPDGLVVAFGSLYSVGDIMRALSA